MPKSHVTILLLTISAAIAWFYIYSNIPPIDDGKLNTPILIAFVALIGITICGIYTVISYRIKLLFHPFLDSRQATRNSLRQGTLLGGGISFLLLLIVTNALNPFTLVLTIVSLVSLELFFH
jgi:hypothetical protein